jgi:hypothetical protein
MSIHCVYCGHAHERAAEVRSCFELTEQGVDLRRPMEVPMVEVMKPSENARPYQGIQPRSAPHEDRWGDGGRSRAAEWKRNRPPAKPKYK